MASTKEVAAASADDQLGAMVAAHQSAEADARAAEFLGGQESREPRAVESRPMSEGGDLLRVFNVKEILVVKRESRDRL